MSDAQAHARFVRDWNAALALVAMVALVAFVAGHAAIGIAAATLCGLAALARARAMRQQGRSFYGLENPSTRDGG